jgi:hypothetical protein
VSKHPSSGRLRLGGLAVKTSQKATQIFVDHPMVDLLLAILVPIGIKVSKAWLPLSGLSKGEREVLYQTFSGASGALLGLGVIAVTILFTITPKDRLKSVLQKVGPGLEGLVSRSLGGIAAATAGYALLIAFDSKTNPGFSKWIFTGLAIFTFSRFSRLWWLLRRILRALALDSMEFIA